MSNLHFMEIAYLVGTCREHFSSTSAFSFIDHNGKNWMIEQKWNQKLLSPRTVLVCIYGDATAENSVFGFASP